VESVIEDAYAVAGEGVPFIRAVRSENRVNFLEISRRHWLAVKTPSSELDTHDLFLRYLIGS
jgi:hypothetical protein